MIRGAKRGMLILAAAVAVTGRCAAVPSDRITVTFAEGYSPNAPEDPATAQILKLARDDGRLDPQPWGGISLPGGAGRSALMMSIAGNTAPDLYYCWFHVIRSDIENRFLHPLNEWIGDDRNGNGQIDDDEARWPGWRRIPLLWRQVATQDGRVYGLPYAGMMPFGLLYRKDLVRSAGLDPEATPETWDEFFVWCQKLTHPERQYSGARVQRGQRALILSPAPHEWLPWLQAAGGSPVLQERTSPTTGKVHVFPMEATTFKAPETGEDLTRVPSVWKANFDSPESVAAAGFFQKLMWAPWVRDPETQEPVTLTGEEEANGVATRSGREIRFQPADVIRGVARAAMIEESDVGSLLQRGEVVISYADPSSVRQLARQVGLPPDMVGLMPFPARDRTCKPVVQVHKHYYAMTEGVGRRPKEERDRVWKCLEALVSEDVRDAEIGRNVFEGNAMWCAPDDLERLGFKEYLAEISPGLRRFYGRAATGEVLQRTEPFVGFWQAASDLIGRNVLSILLSETGRDFDPAAALRQVNADANRGLMFKTPREVLNRRRPLARVLFGLGAAALAVCVWLIVRDQRAARRAAPAVTVRRGLAPWLMLAPALLSIGLWTYYPLLRGAVMAFQDYKIVGGSPWVGLDNFIAVAGDLNFWATCGRTLKFVTLSLLLGFLCPIVLAFLLTEVPRGKIFFRTLFFLPQLTSGIVIALMWKLMYDPTENGLLNQLLAMAGLPRQAWLLDPAWAMTCCILPGVWAGAGMASLIYIAALGSLPQDYYEAAAIDGAGILARIRHVALPQVMPLIVINFVGAFIGAFQGMGSIFLLTFGGPGNETTVLSLAIWKEAYNNLRFSAATTMAWFLGVGLIGFTYLQIRFLRRVEFRRVDAN